MAALTGLTLNSTYGGLVIFPNNTGVTSSIQYLTDGVGGASVLGLSSAGVTVNGTFKIGTNTLVLSGGNSITFTTTGTTTITLPTSGTLVSTDATQTLTNKTLTNPIIGTIANTGTLTLPTATDTLVARTTTDTLTNKTLTSPILSTPYITSAGVGNIQIISNDVLGSNKILAIGLNGNTSKTLTVGNDFSLTGGFATTINVLGNSATFASNTAAPATFTFPAATDTMVGRASTDTLLNKTLVTPALGAATATSINGATVTTTSGGTLTLANSSTLATSGAFSTTLTATAATNVTLPTTGTIARVKLSSQTAATSGNIAFTALPTGYTQYIIVFSGVYPATSTANLTCVFGTGAGPTYTVAGYMWSAFAIKAATTTGSVGSTSDSSFQITTSQGNSAGTALNGELHLTLGSTQGGLFDIRYVDSAGAALRNSGFAYINDGTVITAVKFAYSSGNITAGTFTLYGIL